MRFEGAVGISRIISGLRLVVMLTHRKMLSLSTADGLKIVQGEVSRGNRDQHLRRNCSEPQASTFSSTSERSYIAIPHLNKTI